MAEPIKEVTGFQSIVAGADVARALEAEDALRHATAAEDLVVAEVAEPSELGFWKLAAIRFLHHRTATISLGIPLVHRAGRSPGADLPG